MLDADSVFERLLREAANLVPKMSTPKLTNALNVTSQLQQKITGTLTLRLQQESDGSQSDISVVSIPYEQPSLSNCLTSSNITGPSLCTTSTQPSTFPSESNEKNLGTLRCEVKFNNQDISLAKIVNLDYADDIVLLDPNSAESSTPTDNVPGFHEHPSSTSDYSVHSSSTVSLGSSVPTSGHYGTILIPFTQSDCPITTFAGGDCVSSYTEANTISYVNVLLSQKTTSAVGTPPPNGQASGSESSSLPGTHSTPTTQSVGMKQEPMERHSSPLMSTSVLSTTTLSGIPSLTSCTTNPLPSSQLTSSPLVLVDNASLSAPEGNSSSSKSAPGNGPYRCKDCNKEFRILRYLEKHRRIHTGEKPYQCCYCGRQFNDWPNMNRHKRIHTGERPYRCSFCAKTFSQPAVYNEHVKRHTGERPYVCMVCAKGFPRAARLAVHMRVHTGERPYPCTACDRRFSQPHHLAAHLRIHSGVRPYSCPKCDVSFACISNLRRHRKQVHASSPITEEENESSGANDKKPGLRRLSASLPAIESTVACSVGDHGLTSLSSTLGTDSSVAIAAAMSGTLLTATGALVPAGLLSASSLPGLIFTSGPQGTLIAASHPFAEQQQQQSMLAHASGMNDPLGTSLMSTSGVPTLMTHSTISTTSNPDSLPKSTPQSSTVSLVIPSMLTSSGGGDNMKPTTFTFLTPTGELDRSAFLGTTLSTGGHDGGGFLVNSASGETVYLEPLDPRLTLDPSHQFTLTTIPTSLSQCATTIFGPGASGTHLLGHPIQLQPGSHTAHIAFATNLSGQSHLLAPASSVFSASTVPQHASIYGGQTSPAIILAPSSTNQVSATSSTTTCNDSSLHDTLESVLHNPTPCSSEQDMNSCDSGSALSNPHSGSFIPLRHSTVSAVSSTGEGSDSCVIYTAHWPTTFTTSGVNHTSKASNNEENPDSLVFVTSRPSSVLSTSSTGVAPGNENF